VTRGPRRFRKWVYAGFGLGLLLLVLSVLSWFVGPGADEDAIALRLMITAVSFLVIVGSVVGWIATSGT
jgi:uncharacterized PurR-regulated membrane protein YhhQ (DUF165 family)